MEKENETSKVDKKRDKTQGISLCEPIHSEAEQQIQNINQQKPFIYKGSSGLITVLKRGRKRKKKSFERTIVTG